jgi:uncharacterized protein
VPACSGERVESTVGGSARVCCVEHTSLARRSMIVVSDTSAITSLIQIGHVHLLAGLYDEVLIPNRRRRRTLSRSRPASSISHRKAGEGPATAETLTGEFGSRRSRGNCAGGSNEERFLLIDERRGRRLAAREGVRVIGLVGVLMYAKQRSFVPAVRPLLENLRQVEAVDSHRSSCKMWSPKLARPDQFTFATTKSS